MTCCNNAKNTTRPYLGAQRGAGVCWMDCPSEGTSNDLMAPQLAGVIIASSHLLLLCPYRSDQQLMHADWMALHASDLLAMILAPQHLPHLPHSYLTLISLIYLTLISPHSSTSLLSPPHVISLPPLIGEMSFTASSISRSLTDPLPPSSGGRDHVPLHLHPVQPLHHRLSRSLLRQVHPR